MSDWIKHDGKGCPVDTLDLVLIAGSDGQYRVGIARDFARMWKWGTHFEVDIVAYQVVKPCKLIDD